VQAEAERQAMRGAGESVVCVAVIYGVLRDEIVRAIEPRLGRIGGETGNGVENCGKRFGVDDDQTRGIFGDGAARRDDKRDRLADISELVTCERIRIDVEAKRA